MDTNLTRKEHGLEGAGSMDKCADLPNLPDEVIVASASAIKTDTVASVLNDLYPQCVFTVIGRKVASGVPEQPLGRQTIEGALNRLNAVVARHDIANVAIIAIENGLFRVSKAGDDSNGNDDSDTLLYSEGADLTPDFDASAEYEDRAVVAVKLPGLPVVVQLSLSTDAVLFPHDAVREAYAMPGGFNEHTVGAVLYRHGTVTDMQNPHIELTSGHFSRQTQMAHAIVLALQRLGAV